MRQSSVPVSPLDICCNRVSHEDSEAILDKFRVVLSHEPKKLLWRETFKFFLSHM